MPNKTNDQVILDEIIAQRQAEVGKSLDDSEFFEIYTAERILKDYDLSYDELQSGVVAGGNDGGIDSMFTFVNGELIAEDTDLSVFKKEIVIDVVFVQAKMSAGFGEEPINKFIAAVNDLLNLSYDLGDLDQVYNEELRERVEYFRQTYRTLAGRLPKLRVHFFYATKGSIISDNVARKVPVLQQTVNGLFSDAEVEFAFVGAAELLGMARRQPATTFDLQLAESPITSVRAIGFICIVKLRDYFEFITDDDAVVRRNMFEANVRDYQGNVQVNNDIQETLRGDRDEEFWWLNNGVTIVASNATLTGKTITIEDPFIVNGLQTSTEIFNYFADANTEGDERCLQVKIVVPEADQSRDRIIKATNFQTTIPGVSLRATEKIHRDIEDYLKNFGIYYDRRKNFYKNEGKPIDQILSIGQLSQAVMSVLLKQPDDARARPSTIIKDDENYTKVFNPEYPLELYLICAELLKRTERLLKKPEISLERRDRNNLRFYVAMHAAMSVIGKTELVPSEIAGIKADSISEEVLTSSLKTVDEAYRELGGTDQVAKGKELVEKITSSFGDQPLLIQ